jgi:tetratricopeptide (TPR) repeat protein
MKRPPSGSAPGAPVADTPDVHATLDRLERTIRYSDGLTLAFAKCNSPAQQREMSAALLHRLQDLHVLEVELEEPIVSLLDFLMERWNAAEPPQAVFVYGLEKSIGEAREFSPVFLRLNHDRELLRRSIPAPLLLWLPDFALDCVVRGAPDFWAWRSGVYEFPTERGLWHDEARDAYYRSASTLFSLDLAEKRAEIGRLESLLRATQQLTRRNPRDRRIEARLALQLGLLYKSVGEWDQAREVFASAASIYRELGDDQEWAVTMGQIADLFQLRDEFDEALRIRHEQQLPVFEQLGDDRNAALTLAGIADALQARGDLDEALRIRRERVLPIFERLGDVREQAITMSQIADVLQARGDLDEALRIRREEELPIFERLGDHRNRALTMGRIADALYARGEFEEALRVYREEQLPVNERLGDVHSRAITMGKIADVLQARGDLDEALRIRRKEELPVFERLGDMRERAVTMGKIAYILQARGDLDEAIRISREDELPVLARIGETRDHLVAETNLASLLIRRAAPGDRDAAHELLQHALGAARRLRIPEADQIEAFQRRLNRETPPLPELGEGAGG